jgi:hypothetical protein
MSLAPSPGLPAVRASLSATWHTTRRELRIAALGRRGRLVLAAVVLCGTIAGGLRVLAQRGAGPTAVETSARQQLANVASVFGTKAASDLSVHPPALVSLCLFFMVAVPGILVLAGHDLGARDVLTGVMRFVRHRASPFAVMAGKVFGLWAAISAAVLAAYVVVALLLVGSAGAALSDTFPSALRLWSACALAALPYAAMMVALGAVSLSPSRTLLSGLVAMAVLAMVRARYVGAAGLERWLIPSTNEAALLAREWAVVAGAAGRLAVWTACWIVIAGLVLRRQRI